MKIHKLAILIFIFLFPVNGFAEDDLLEILRDNGTLTRKQYKKLKLRKNKSGSQRVVEGLRQESRDFKFRIGGRLMIDAAVYDEDDQDLGSGTNIRRARLFFAGKVYEDWKFRTQIEFADNLVSIRDAFIAYAGFEKTLIKIGNFYESFGLESWTSSKFDPFMEDSLSVIFSPGRNIGVAAYTYGDRWTVSGGVFGEGPGDSRTDGEGFGASGRLTFSPIHQKKKAVHLGVAVAFRGVPDDTQSVTFSSKPESNVTPVSLVNTGAITDSLSFINWVLEAAVVVGPFSVQGEYVQSHLHRKDNNPNAQFQGSYIFASWFLTGESRPYNYKSAIFSRVKPNKNAGQGGIGAWEAAIRYSQIDLNDGVIRGGEEENITLGLNWYVNPLIRFMGNVVFIDTDPVAGNVNATAIQMRAQIDF
ncbi:MAG: hypothetical protein HOJ79_09830 [Nitrospina sp.]|mgnify:CR=1 FL=1|jgi:phosphate-selective porin OprO and OprP|nr:hypothetical protein [Nitrospina sp.]